MSLPIVFPGMVTGTALALALWLLFRFVPRIAPDIRAWSWRLVLLKLAVSAFAVGQVTLHLLPAAAPAARERSILRPAPLAQEVTELAVPLAKLELRSLAPSRPNPLASAKSPEQATANSELSAVDIWAVGIAFFFVQALFVAIRTRRAFRHVVPVTDQEIVGCLKALSNSAGLPRPPRLVCLDSAPSAMVCGIRQPIIVVPDRLASGLSEDLSLALGHEIAHIRRRDLAWTSISWLVRSALFFNPVVWLVDRELRVAQESATDQEAVWLTGASVAAYGKMLLSAMNPERVAWQPSGLAMFDSFRDAKRRLRAMKHFSQQPHATRKLAVATLVAVGIGCLPTYLLVPADAASVLQAESGPNATPSAPKTVKSLPGEKRAVSKSSTSRAHPRSQKLIAKLDRKPWPFTANDGGSTSSGLSGPKALPPKLQPDIKFVEEQPSASAVPESEEFKQASKAAQDEFNAQVSKLFTDQDQRIADYRRGADQREREAEQRERDAQQRKREAEWRARGVLLREQVIEANEKDGYRIAGPGQREADARQRQAADRQTERDQYQSVLDQKQRETDQWQRQFDQNTIAAMREETRQGVAAARKKYQERIAELVADDASRRREASGAIAYTANQAKLEVSSGLHYVKASPGLSFAIPNGYEVVRVQTIGKGSYTVVLRRKKS